MRQVLRITDLPGTMKKHTTWQACFDKAMLQYFNIQIVIILSVRICPARLSKFVPCLLGAQRSSVSLAHDNIAVLGIGLNKPTKLGTEVGGFAYCNVLMAKQFWITNPPTRYFLNGVGGLLWCNLLIISVYMGWNPPTTGRPNPVRVELNR